MPLTSAAGGDHLDVLLGRAVAGQGREARRVGDHRVRIRPHPAQDVAGEGMPCGIGIGAEARHIAALQGNDIGKVQAALQQPAHRSVGQAEEHDRRLRPPLPRDARRGQHGGNGEGDHFHD